MRELALRWLPPPEALLNEFVNRIPLASLRMRAYAATGVRVADPRQSTIMLHTEVFTPRGLTIGARSIVGRHCLLDARAGITLGDDVNISSYSRFMTAKHLIDDPDFDGEYLPITVGDRAWVALGATVLGGVRIGEGAVVAAGAVVTKDVPDYTVVAGVPAVPVRERSRDLRYRLGYFPNWL